MRRDAIDLTYLGSLPSSAGEYPSPGGGGIGMRIGGEMARRQKQDLTAAEQRQEIQQLTRESKRIQARLAQLTGGQGTNNQSKQARGTQAPIQRTQAKQAPPKIPRVAIRPMIPEAQLENKDYLVRQYRLTHPWLTESEALGDVCVQNFNIALPRVRRQEAARLTKQQQPTQQPKVGAAQPPA
jgi:CRP-like cAMP-binding protein